MTVSLMVLLFLVFMLVGAPIGFAMGLSAVIALFTTSSVPLVLLPQNFYIAIDNFSYLAIPLFILVGELMNVSGITDRLVRFSKAALGHHKGGLAKANVATNTFMSAISGSAVADVTAVGSMMIPAMTKNGYKPQFSVAVTSCAAMLGPILPPSIIAVIYGSLTGVSVGQLFLGGILPGFVGAAALLTLVHFLASRSGGAPQAKAPPGELLAALLNAWPAMLLPIFMVGGIVSGLVTPTESGAIAVVYGLVLTLIYRRFKLVPFLGSVRDAAIVTSSTLVVIAGSALFSWVLTRSGVPQTALSFLLQLTSDPTILMLILLVFLFLLGIVLEPTPALILIVPVLVPLSETMHFHPVTLGISVIMMLTLGSVSPPVGVLAMIACKIAGIGYSSTFKILVPFMLAWMVATLLTAFVPPLTTFLPSLMQ